MSHAATNWAIQRRGLKPTTKIVLWHLCDRFNPDYGCFPSQARLAHDCEISRSTLNDHLGQLEAAGLVRRVPRIHSVTKRQGRGSTIVTSQLPVDQWFEVIGDPTLADAILDRLVHNAHRLTLTGDSMRRKMSTMKTLDQGVAP